MLSTQTGQRFSSPPESVMAKYLPNQETERANMLSKNRPLQLLDLPLDILQAVMAKVTHTNDLTSLALTHSILHTLVVPYIYSRFDIVWPDAGPAVESRAGVDALTYGLATLVMAQDVFGEGNDRQKHTACAICGCQGFCQHCPAPARPRKTRRGNHFAQFTRKFSLGNGPEEWVKEYLITKEGGKMLGTLVALAVGRMRNLESFTWDMPTGVLRDVWLALASLDDRDDGQECRLERVWVRWHDNNQDNLPSAPTFQADLPQLLSSFGRPLFRIPPYPRVEFPTFSVLPPLKSLSVLDIDELSYVEELSVLIERSLTRLQELRISLAPHAQSRYWARPQEDRSLVPAPLTQSGDQVQRRGGLLGILVSRFCAAFNDAATGLGQSSVTPSRSEAIQPRWDNFKVGGEIEGGKQEFDHSEHGVNIIGSLLSAQVLEDEVMVAPDPNQAQSGNEYSTSSVSGYHEVGRDIQEKLRLEILELERVYLSLPVLFGAFDWSRLRTLTILSCRDHEQLWKSLRKRFTPQTLTRPCSISRPSAPSESHTRHRLTSETWSPVPAAEYELRITRIHTDTVSPALLAFMKDALAPDTLEHLFLQQCSAYKSNVTIDQIYKHTVRRHRTSLKKLLIDSEIRMVDGTPDGNTNWRKWALSRELITCITSGRMRLRELSLSIDYKDWHYFLQRLPNASNLRSLHIGHIADYVHNRFDPREAALQILDIVALRPELELCYLGFQDKCYEIVEYLEGSKTPSMSHEFADVIPSAIIDDDEISDEHDEPEAVDIDSDDPGLTTDRDDIDDTEDEAQQGCQKNALRLREILFYDDKISIFKARHGRV